MAKGKKTSNSFWFKRTFYPAGMLYSKIPEELRKRDEEIEAAKDGKSGREALTFNTVEAPPSAPAGRPNPKPEVKEDGDSGE